MFGIGKKKDEAAAPVEPSMASADVPLAPAATMPAVEMHPAGFWLRVVAFIVDYAVLLILLAAMMMGAASVGGEDLLEPTYCLWILVSFFYWPVLESTAWRATVGRNRHCAGRPGARAAGCAAVALGLGTGLRHGRFFRAFPWRGAWSGNSARRLAWGYGAGMIAATAALHASGVLAGIKARALALRLAGAAVSIAGMGMLMLA